MNVQYGVAIDQHGRVYHFGKHPRKDLCEQIGCKHVDKMYAEKKDGSSRHIGYVIGGHWLRVYAPVEVAA